MVYKNIFTTQCGEPIILLCITYKCLQLLVVNLIPLSKN